MQSLSREYLLGLSKVNPEFEELRSKLPVVEALNVNSDLHTYRAIITAWMNSQKASMSVPTVANYEEEDRQIAMRDGAYITVRIHRPKKRPTDGCPVFIVYHGGGFCFGDLESEAVLCRQWVELGGVAVNVDYRLAPEHPFPGPVRDTFDALKWTAAHTEELGVNPAKGFLIGGTSAGANLSAVVSHLFRDEGIYPPLTGLYLSIPAVCQPEALPEKYKEFYLSREQNKDAPGLNSASMAFYEKHYKSDSFSPLRCPLLFASHKDLPPTYFQMCGLDPLRDEAFIMEKIMREECGIATRVDVYPGLPHGFWAVFPQASFTKKMWTDSVEALKWLLEQSK